VTARLWEDTILKLRGEWDEEYEAMEQGYRESTESWAEVLRSDPVAAEWQVTSRVAARRGPSTSTAG
jgi:hypothetical protein